MPAHSSLHRVDVHVGLRVRALRRERQISQETLAKSVGITFQQVQKYENGANRVSASVLFGFGEALGVPVAQFYEGLDQATASSSRAHILDTVLALPGGREYLEAFARLPADVRPQAVHFMTAITGAR